MLAPCAVSKYPIACMRVHALCVTQQKGLEDGPATLHKPAVRRCMVNSSHCAIMLPERLMQHSRLEVAGQLDTVLTLLLLRHPGSGKHPSR